MNEPEQFMANLIEDNRGTLVSISETDAIHIEFRANSLVAGMVGYFAGNLSLTNSIYGAELPLVPQLTEQISVTADTTFFTADVTFLTADNFS